jgi:ferrochelatase
MESEKSGGFHHSSVPTLGVLLANLGTPDAPTPAALRRYLGEFLWDRRIVDLPRPLWWLILHGVILRVRPAKSAHAYQSVWTEEGSPLLVYARRQASALQEQLTARLHGPVRVALGMRYGNPSIAAALEELRAARCERILVLPAYPQYASATTASTFDAVSATFQQWPWLPELRMITHYHDDEGYITALARSVREHWGTHGRPDVLLFSFHGMPKRTLLAGDPYFCHCHKTARLVAERLQLTPAQWRVAFQSRFGREEWLKPYADETLKGLPAEGFKRVDVICPGFAADCLETLEEMAQQNRALFLAAGGQKYSYIGALNARDDHMQALADLAVRHLQGWPEAEAGWSASAAAEEAEASAVRARALGATD